LTFQKSNNVPTFENFFLCLVKDEALDAADETPPGDVFVDFVLKSQKFLKSQWFSAKSALQQLYTAKHQWYSAKSALQQLYTAKHQWFSAKSALQQLYIANLALPCVSVCERV
jgi:hypothetical protein